MSAVTALAGLLFGFDTGIISGAQAFIFETFNLTNKTLETAATKGFIVASVPFGALLGALVSGFFASYYGRRRSLLITSILFIVGALVTALAPAIDYIIYGRMIMGVAIGISAMVAPMYLSEISPPQIRGILVSFFQLAITIGIVGAFITNYLCAQWIPNYMLNWRWMFGLGAIPAVGLFTGMLNMPCSPRWLFAQGKKKQAQQTLQYIYQREDVSQELSEIQTSLSRQEGSWIDCFKPQLLPLVLMSFGLFVLQQLTGINAIMYYGPSVFEQVGFGESTKHLAQIAIGTINVGMTIVSLYMIDRKGRRPLLFGGFAGMFVCLGLLSFFLTQPHSPLLGWLSLLAVLAFIGCFAVSLGPIPYLIMSEVFPLKVRASSMAIASCANWAFNMLVTESFPVLQHTLGMSMTFLIFALCSAAGIIFTAKYVPETRNCHLETIEKNLYAGLRLKDLGK